MKAKAYHTEEVMYMRTIEEMRNDIDELGKSDDVSMDKIRKGFDLLGELQDWRDAEHLKDLQTVEKAATITGVFLGATLVLLGFGIKLWIQK